jgi:uncharacterized tellurite resistance protein B-like protein
MQLTKFAKLDLPMSNDERPPHPAAALPHNGRVEYLIAVAALVYADGEVAPGEIEIIRALSKILDLPDGAHNLVVASAKFPDYKRVDGILAKFRGDPLRYTLLCDAVLVAFADGKLRPSETHELARFAHALGISSAQAVKIGAYVAESHTEHAELAEELRESMAEAREHVHPVKGLRAMWRRLLGK